MADAVFATRPVVLTGGRPLAPGDGVVRVDVSDPHEQALIEAGALIREPAPRKPARKPAPKPSAPRRRTPTSEGGAS